MLKNRICGLINKYKRQRFLSCFASIGKSSGFGPIGYGDTCVIWDKKRIFVGDYSWFGRESTIRVLSSYNYADGVQPLSGKLTIGNNVHCTEKCLIVCAGNMIIEDNVLIAPEVFIIDNNHGMNPNTGGGYSNQPIIVKDVHIEEGAWLGQRVCVMPGVTIGAHSIIGANSIVTHDVPPYSIAAGSPARVVKRWCHDKQEWIPVKKNDN